MTRRCPSTCVNCRANGMHRILLTCAGSADFVPIIRDFASRSDVTLIAADAHPELRLASVTPHAVRLPPGSAPAFVDAVFTLAVRERIAFIIPKADEEAFALARSRARFADAGIALAGQDDILSPMLQSKSACYA